MRKDTSAIASITPDQNLAARLILRLWNALVFFGERRNETWVRTLHASQAHLLSCSCSGIKS